MKIRTEEKGRLLIVSEAPYAQYNGRYWMYDDDAKSFKQISEDPTTTEGDLLTWLDDHTLVPDEYYYLGGEHF
jgi:hypothetical protein